MVDQVNLSVEYRTKVPNSYTRGQNHDFAFTVHNAGPAALPAGALVRLTAPHGNFVSGFTAVGTGEVPAPQFTAPAPSFLTYSGGPTHTSVTLDATTTVDVPAGGSLQVQGYFSTTTAPSPDLYYDCPNGGSPNGAFAVRINPAPGQRSADGNRLENIGPASNNVLCLPYVQIADAPPATWTAPTPPGSDQRSPGSRRPSAAPARGSARPAPRASSPRPRRTSGRRRCPATGSRPTSSPATG